MKNFLLLLCCCCCFACSPKKGKKLQKGQNTDWIVSDTLSKNEEQESFFESPIDSTAEIVIEEEPPPPHLIFSLRKTSCYGQCPTYHIKLFSDGRALYEGKKYVARLGHYETRIGPDLIDQIGAWAKRYGFFTFGEQYPQDGFFMADLPSTITHLKLDGEEATITNNYDGPKALRDLEKELELFFEALNWTLIQRASDH